MTDQDIPAAEAGADVSADGVPGEVGPTVADTLMR